MTYWSPAVRGRGQTSDRPAAGTLIAFRRRPWRVVETKDRRPVDWSDEVRDRWQSQGMPDPWTFAPYAIILQPLPGGKRQHFEVQPDRHFHWWEPLPEHYAVCVVCGELAPCSEITAERAARQVMERFDRLAGILPGCCWSCGEPVTSRQESRTFPGPNVWMPTAGSAPIFHLRRSCVSGAANYEEDWVAAEPGRERSLLTLKCSGSLVWHGDGTAECFGAVDSDCPGTGAWHGYMIACYVQSHGCPRGCDRATHPGCGPRRRRTVR